MAKIINGSSLALALANYLCTNAYLNDTAQDVLIMVGNWIDEAQEITVPKWIPVSERLPEKPGYVLAYWKYIQEDEMYIDRLNYNGECFPWENFGFNGKHKVTHWMPLPEPPKEEDNG